MIITIDGLDGCGKSTLAKKLANRLNFEYIDKPLYNLFNVKGDNNRLYDALYEMQDIIFNGETSTDRIKSFFISLGLLFIKDSPHPNKNIVVDRGLLSCYAFNGNDSTDEIFEFVIDKLGLWFDVSILLYASPEVRKQRLIARNPNDPDLKAKKIMNLGYESIDSFLSSHNNLSVIKINTDSLTEDEVFETAISLLYEKCALEDLSTKVT